MQKIIKKKGRTCDNKFLKSPFELLRKSDYRIGISMESYMKVTHFLNHD